MVFQCIKDTVSRERKIVKVGFLNKSVLNHRERDGLQLGREQLWGKQAHTLS